MFEAARVAPPLTTGKHAINNLLTGEGRYRIVARAKARYGVTFDQFVLIISAAFYLGEKLFWLALLIFCSFF